MARPNTTPPSGVRHTVQNIWNWGFDDDFGLPMVEMLVYNPVTDQMERMTQSDETLPNTGVNPSLVLGYDGSGNLTTITKTINAVQYQKTLTYTANVLTGVSVWVAL